jgi:hypothetical protein
MRHTWLAVCAVVLSLGASVFPDPSGLADASRADRGRLVADSDTVNLGGLYVPVGTVPKWCDVTYMGIEVGNRTIHARSIRGVLALDSTDNGPHLEFWDGALDGRHFTFTTEQKKSLSYAFSGDFLRFNPSQMEASNAPILVGRLRKRIDGRVVAEADVKFRYIIVD